MLFLPIGHDQSIRRFPWLTVAIMAICVLLQLHRTLFGPSIFELGDAARESEKRGLAVLQRVGVPQQPAEPEDDEELAPHPAPAPFAQPAPITLPSDLQGADGKKVLDAARAGKLGDDPTIAAYRAAHDRFVEMQRRDLVQAWGYRPSSGASINLLLSAFVHGGWIHLAGNLLFLWLCGCNLEDKWGRVAFAVVYLSSALVSSIAFALWHRGSDVPLVGASGAIAGAMGAFLIRFHSAQIKYWWWYGFRTGTTYLPAYVAFPVWFLSQLGQSFLEASGFDEVAYSAHVGGFVCGMAFGTVIRFGGIERRWLADPDEEEDAAPPPPLPIALTREVPPDPFVRAKSLRPAAPEARSVPPAPNAAARSVPPSPAPELLPPPADLPDVAPWPPPIADVAPWPPPVAAEPPRRMDSTIPIDSPMEALRRALEADPSRDDLRYELCKHAIGARDADSIEATATRTLLWLGEQSRWRDVRSLHDALLASGIERPLSDRAFSMLVRSAVECRDPKRCVQVAQKMANAFPSSPLLPRALWDVATAQHDGGRPDLARKTLTQLVTRFPEHRFADEARQRLRAIG
ncbi:MAG: rhomboid family intramembrane serine protease [Deltaproteobacteria bacterium]|nr:rhomboid family intramembrane serine protease [Deltaproteobacteria bacterium]